MKTLMIFTIFLFIACSSYTQSVPETIECTARGEDYVLICHRDKSQKLCYLRPLPFEKKTPVCKVIKKGVPNEQSNP